MALTGDLIDYPLAELLFFLSSKQRSGCLDITHPSMAIRFTLRRGRLVAARSNHAEQRLGSRLITEGRLSALHLTVALSRQMSHIEHKPLGAILVEMGLVEQSDVQRVLRDQIADCLFHLLIASEGTFRFERGQPDVAGIDLDLTIEHEVLDAIRRADEWTAHRLDTASFRLNEQVTPDVLEPHIAEYWDVIDALMDEVLTVDTVAERTERSRASAADALLRLHAHSVVTIVHEFTPSTTDNRVIFMA